MTTDLGKKIRREFQWLKFLNLLLLSGVKNLAPSEVMQVHTCMICQITWRGGDARWQFAGREEGDMRDGGLVTRDDKQWHEEICDQHAIPSEGIMSWQQE